jgi:hypothetical protein
MQRTVELIWCRKYVVVGKLMVPNSLVLMSWVQDYSENYQYIWVN